jgi:hypothetical protein
VELKVGGDEVVDRGIDRDGVKDLAELGLLLGRHPDRRHPGGGGLEDAAHLEELEHGVVTVEVDDEAQHVEHVDQGQRLHRLTQRVTRQAEFGRQVGLPRQLLPRPHPAGEDHLLDLADRLVRQCHGPAPDPASPSAAVSPSR